MSQSTSVENDGVRAPGAVPVRRGLFFSKRRLFFGSVLVFAALGVGAAVLVHPRFHDFIPKLLKKFEREQSLPRAKRLQA